MKKAPSKQTSTEATVQAAQGFTRRVLFRRLAMLGTAAAMGPWVIKDALSFSGRLNLLLGIGLWMGPRPAQPSWFAEMHTQYAEKFKAA